MMELNKIHNIDCMVGMGKFPDKYFDLAIVDPPYGDGNKQNLKHVKWNKKPNKKYFTELKRVSKNQIIWGGNYFINNLTSTRCFIVWDKATSQQGLYSDCELAWTSLDKITKLYRHKRPGLTGFFNVEGERIHPTQKPIKLYHWILKNYADAGWKILDTHVGSGSSIIACEYMGFEYCGFEIDEEYWAVANTRLEKEREKMKQTSLFGEMQV